jgi:hypothetical protein
MKSIKFIILLLILVTASSCDYRFTINSIEGNGNVIKDDRIFSEKIDVIKASNGLDIEVANSTVQVVSVEADENLQDIIETELKNGVLYVRTTKNIRKAKSKKVTIAFVELDGIHASSGTNVKGLSSVVSNNLDLKVSSGAQMSLTVMAKELAAQASSGGNITLRGQARNFGTKASSGSSIDARELQAIYCTSRASSGANITLNIERSLDAKASSGGDIRYQGNPEVVNQNTSSSGSVRKM